jgi:hypothetical protein
MKGMRLQLALAALLLAACGDPPPPWCEPRAPLDASCAGPECVAAVVVDYKRLEPRGFRVFSLSGAPIDRKAAEALANEHLVKVLKQPPADQSDVDATGDFYNCFLRYQLTGDSWLIVIHAPTGQVLFSGFELWADPTKRGYDFPLPEGFQDTAPLGCVDPGAAEPESKRFVTTGVPSGSVVASTAAEAWGVAQRLNLTAELTRGHSYRVMTISYAPAVGEFDPESADWYVWIYRR